MCYNFCHVLRFETQNLFFMKKTMLLMLLFSGVTLGFAKSGEKKTFKQGGCVLKPVYEKVYFSDGEGSEDYELVQVGWQKVC